MDYLGHFRTAVESRRLFCTVKFAAAAFGKGPVACTLRREVLRFQTRAVPTAPERDGALSSQGVAAALEEASAQSGSVTLASHDATAIDVIRGCASSGCRNGLAVLDSVAAALKKACSERIPIRRIDKPLSPEHRTAKVPPMQQQQIPPHGGSLVNRVPSELRRAELEREAKSLQAIELTDEQADDVWNIATGLFSPLSGFMSRQDIESVVERRRLPSNAAWTLPIVLDVEMVRAPGRIALTHHGKPIAVMDAGPPFEFDRRRLARAVFGTEDPKHPGVAHTFALKPKFVGGPIELIRAPESPHASYRLTPAQTRAAFREAGLATVAAFQTRNPPHIAHEFLQKLALNHCDGLFINPVIGKKKAGDFTDDVILRCYETLREKFHPKTRVFLGTLHTWMRYAGPMEAIFHGIVRQNFGCTHLIVGRDHAGVGNYYPPFAAQEIFSEFPDLQIRPLKYPAAFYCRACAMYTTSTTCPHGPDQQVSVSGTLIRKAIQDGGKLEFVIRDEILEVIRRFQTPFVE